MKSFRARMAQIEPPAPGRNGERQFPTTKKRSNDHTAPPGPQAKLYKKGRGKEAGSASWGTALEKPAGRS